MVTSSKLCKECGGSKVGQSLVTTFMPKTPDNPKGKTLHYDTCHRCQGTGEEPEGGIAGEKTS